mmetsp:Transcript_129936/g.193427  ORF Transcript_129936/g.193427 Transcript_129936/m.193427 type:complete len:104 (-) Transcript_129936:52-363(-)
MLSTSSTSASDTQEARHASDARKLKMIHFSRFFVVVTFVVPCRKNTAHGAKHADGAGLPPISNSAVTHRITLLIRSRAGFPNLYNLSIIVCVYYLQCNEKRVQ